MARINWERFDHWGTGSVEELRGYVGHLLRQRDALRARIRACGDFIGDDNCAACAEALKTGVGRKQMDWNEKRMSCLHLHVEKTGENMYVCLECESTATAVTAKNGTWTRTWKLNPKIWTEWK